MIDCLNIGLWSAHLTVVTRAIIVCIVLFVSCNLLKKLGLFLDFSSAFGGFPDFTPTFSKSESSSDGHSIWIPLVLMKMAIVDFV